MGAVAAALVRAVALVRSPAAARKLYASLRHLPSPGGEFWHAVLDMELEAARAGRGDELPRPRILALFEVGWGGEGARVIMGLSLVAIWPKLGHSLPPPVHKENQSSSGSERARIHGYSPLAAAKLGSMLIAYKPRPWPRRPPWTHMGRRTPTCGCGTCTTPPSRGPRAAPGPFTGRPSGPSRGPLDSWSAASWSDWPELQLS